MGSYVSIGFIYENFSVDRIQNEFKKLVSKIITFNGNVKKMKISKDFNGEEWAEYEFLNNFQMDSNCEMLADYFYGQLEIDCNLFGGIRLKTILRIEKEKDEDYFGFLMDLSEEELIKFNSADEINRVTEEIIEFMIQFYSCSAYNYAFCNNEGEIQFSPKKFREIENSIYSVTVIPNLVSNNSLKVIKSNWNIDGLTSRV
ncbi:Imm64 family immunity protein [Clostridium polynesiense]|uniref:Imm64 family immunity protein n=1 Tax=Clostridium polynesiense TaxID=1325933 RepID=UPI00058EC6C9|nr:Imm64 family immunity protein [Clostridium polynesiense]